VRDSEGAAIANARVLVHWDPSGSNYLKDNLGIKQDSAEQHCRVPLTQNFGCQYFAI
jgi:hypothetical protein